MFRFKPQKGCSQFYLTSMKTQFLLSILLSIILSSFIPRVLEAQTTKQAVQQQTTPNLSFVSENELQSPQWELISIPDVKNWSEKDQNIWVQVHTLKTTFGTRDVPDVDKIIPFLKQCDVAATSPALKAALKDEIRLGLPFSNDPANIAIVDAAEAKRLNLPVETYKKLSFIFDIENNMNEFNSTHGGTPETLDLWIMEAGNTGHMDIEVTFEKYAEELGVIDKTTLRTKTIDYPKLAYWRAIYNGKSEQIAMQAEQTELLKQQNQQLQQLQWKVDRHENNRR